VGSCDAMAELFLRDFVAKAELKAECKAAEREHIALHKKAAAEKLQMDKKAAAEKLQMERKTAAEKLQQEKKAAAEKLQMEKRALAEKLQMERKAWLEKVQADKKDAKDRLHAQRMVEKAENTTRRRTWLDVQRDATEKVDANKEKKHRRLLVELQCRSAHLRLEVDRRLEVRDRRHPEKQSAGTLYWPGARFREVCLYFAAALLVYMGLCLATYGRRANSHTHLKHPYFPDVGPR
jgi:hypothetical protein